MPRQNRAKLFAPYDALKGFEETVHAKDEVYVRRPELTEYAQDCLDRRLRRLRPGDRVTVTWFRSVSADSGQYRSETGIVRRLDPVYRVLTLGTKRIRIADIIGIEDAPCEER